MDTRGTIPELLMPAGGFDSALASIDGGADALYLGFSEFSARKQAHNFDRLEYRRLHRLAGEKGIKLYVALNTILLEGELEAAAALLAFLGRFPPDAILVQDWGLAALIRKHHPVIAIHASTQAAVQGASATRIAKELGATRVVLPRETSLSEIARLRDEEPGFEYEAFVHGALCYSFSGLCLASGLILGRSGNRGECAQLCRSYYDVENECADDAAAKGPRSGKNGRAYWFSCRDLDLGNRVAALTTAGISSLKVEGRMKSPEYCYAVARLYRGLLDRLEGAGPDEAEIETRRRAARIAFSRSPTEGWLFERGGASLVDSEYPGHRGMSAGRVRSASSSRIVIELETDLGLRDGLLGFEDDDSFKPIRFSATGLRDHRTGRELVKAKAGDRVEMDAPIVDGRRGRFNAGGELFRISARDMDRRAPSQEEYEAGREALRLKLRFEGRRMGADLELPSFTGTRDRSGHFARIDAGEELPFDRAKSGGGFTRALAVFSESGDEDFRLSVEIGPDDKIELPPGKDPAGQSCPAHEIFLPPSILKREKNRIYARAASLVSEAELGYARESTHLDGEIPCDEAAEAKNYNAPPRSTIVFPRRNLPKGMPFATRRDFVEGSTLPIWGERLWLPLAPLVADSEDYGRLVKARVRDELAKGKVLMIGLGALHHIALAREILADEAREGRETGNSLGFFLDFNLYVANRLAFGNLSSLLPRFEFAYRYIEADSSMSRGKEASALGGTRIAPIGEGFEPPLFQSLGCPLKHHATGGACPAECARRWASVLRDRDRRYRLIVEDCVTMLFRLDSKGKDGE